MGLLITIKEASELLGMDTRAAYYYIRRHKVTIYKSAIAHKIKVDRSELENMISVMNTYVRK